MTVAWPTCLRQAPACVKSVWRGMAASWTASPALAALTDRSPRGCVANLLHIYRSQKALSVRRGCLFARHSISDQEDAMKVMLRPFEGQRLKPGDLSTLGIGKGERSGWESIPLVAGKPQHFEIAQQAIKH